MENWFLACTITLTKITGDFVKMLSKICLWDKKKKICKNWHSKQANWQPKIFSNSDKDKRLSEKIGKLWESAYGLGHTYFLPLGESRNSDNSRKARWAELLLNHWGWQFCFLEHERLWLMEDWQHLFKVVLVFIIV